MATAVMETREVRRVWYEHCVEKRHLKLQVLRDIGRAAGLSNEYLFKDCVPAYPQPEFHVSRLKHDTNLPGLRGIREKGGFMSPYRNDALVWFSLKVGPEEIKEAESRPVKVINPDQTEEQIQIQQGSLEKFASSPVFHKSSMYGSYRFTFSVEEVLDAYKKQFCDGEEPDMRVKETVIYKEEVMYAVLIHSPTQRGQFSKYPLLVEPKDGGPIVDKLDPIVSFKDGRFVWRSEAMSETHRFKLVQNGDDQTVETVEFPPFYVWDNVTIALHVGKQTLKFDENKLREKLTFCERGDVPLTRFQDFPTAEEEVKKLWPDYHGPLMQN